MISAPRVQLSARPALRAPVTRRVAVRADPVRFHTSVMRAHVSAAANWFRRPATHIRVGGCPEDIAIAIILFILSNKCCAPVFYTRCGVRCCSMCRLRRNLHCGLFRNLRIHESAVKRVSHSYVYLLSRVLLCIACEPLFHAKIASPTSP